MSKNRHFLYISLSYAQKIIISCAYLAFPKGYADHITQWLRDPHCIKFFCLLQTKSSTIIFQRKPISIPTIKAIAITWMTLLALSFPVVLFLGQFFHLLVFSHRCSPNALFLRALIIFLEISLIGKLPKSSFMNSGSRLAV